MAIHKWPIGPTAESGSISALGEKWNPRNITDMPAVKFFVGRDLNPICLFLDGQ
jgi:hypothetical protein